MKTLLRLPILGSLLWVAVQATGKDQTPTETAAGWVKYAKNQVLGGDLGTCFDISVLKEDDTYGRRGGVEQIGHAIYEGKDLGF
jgi:hypothetical protein